MAFAFLLVNTSNILISFKEFLDYLQLKSFSTKTIDIGSIYTSNIYVQRSCIRSFYTKVAYYMKNSYIGNIYNKNTCDVSICNMTTYDMSICIRCTSVGAICIKISYVKGRNPIF